MKESKSGTPENKEDVKSLKGTVISVSIVGAVIVLMWIAVFGLYMARV